MPYYLYLIHLIFYPFVQYYYLSNISCAVTDSERIGTGVGGGIVNNVLFDSELLLLKSNISSSKKLLLLLLVCVVFILR